jgi:hypothetical protein
MSFLTLIVRYDPENDSSDRVDVFGYTKLEINSLRAVSRDFDQAFYFLLDDYRLR